MSWWLVVCSCRPSATPQERPTCCQCRLDFVFMPERFREQLIRVYYFVIIGDIANRQRFRENALPVGVAIDCLHDAFIRIYFVGDEVMNHSALVDTDIPDLDAFVSTNTCHGRPNHATSQFPLHADS